MAVIGCYSMHLYCDTGGDEYGETCPHRTLNNRGAEYTGQTEGDCITTARRDGWKFNRDKTKAFCPKCSKNKC